MAEEEDYVSLTELAKDMGLKRTSLYYYLTQLKIQPRRFPLNKNAYVTKAEAEHIKAIKKNPWTVEKPVEDAA